MASSARGERSLNLRVAHVVDSLNLGGTETQCVALVRGLAARGIANLVVYGHDGPLRRGLDDPHVTLRPWTSGPFGRPGFVRAVLALARTLRAWRASVVQTYGFYTNLPGLLAGRLARVPVLVGSKRGFDAHLSPARRRVDGVARRLAHATVVNSEALRAWLADAEGRRPLAMIPNCVLEQGPVTPGVDPVVGMVANFLPPKDHATLLRAAASIVEAVPAAELHLVGTGPLEPGARRLADELGVAAHVRFLGRLSPADVWTAINRFAVSVLSSGSEGMPNAVLEAMVAGRPVVASRVRGMDEVVGHGITGFLVPPGDPQALATAVTRLLKDPSTAARMGAAGRERALTAHHPDRMVDDFVRLWSRLGVPDEALEVRQA